MNDTKHVPLASQVETLIRRTINRNLKGLEHIRSSPPQIGVSAKELVLDRGALRLYHYRPLADEIYRTPILTVMATTNRGSIFDLMPGHSLVEYLLRQGYDMYMIDWQPPLPHEKELSLEHYAQTFIAESIAKVLKRSGEPDVTLMGYCMGGVLSVIYQSLNPQGPVKNLVTFTTPADFSKMNMFNVLASKKHFDVDRLVEAVGNVSGEMVFSGFAMRAPSEATAANARLWDNMWNDAFVDSFRKIDKWAVDMLPLAGEYFRDTIKQLLWANGLIEGSLEVGGRVADPKTISVPFLHVIARHDNLVPYEASHPLIDLIGSEDKQEIVLKGGHVSLVAGPNAAKRLWPSIDTWLQERSL
ncbi:MAG: alpha/beta fold hydrolase [Pseudomonadota bacterium]